jgi:hypothetical protein
MPVVVVVVVDDDYDDDFFHFSKKIKFFKSHIPHAQLLRY